MPRFLAVAPSIGPVAVEASCEVAVALRLTADLPNGSRIDEVVIHLWTFGPDGKVTALRRMLDTAANIAAAG